MRVLVACEKSGVVRRAFRDAGHDAWSCDIEPSDDDSEFHLQGDVLTLLDDTHWTRAKEPWDLMIAHPPCTYLCNSGVHWLHNKHEYQIGTEESFEARQEEERTRRRWKDLDTARQFFMTLWEAPIPKICLENPVPHKYGNLPPYSQTIQPYQFGDDASKRTCLWLKGLPKLLIPEESLWVKPRIVDGKPRWGNQTKGGQNALGPGKQRAALRSKTYEGIAAAFAANFDA